MTYYFLCLIKKERIGFKIFGGFTSTIFIYATSNDIIWNRLSKSLQQSAKQIEYI